MAGALHVVHGTCRWTGSETVLRRVFWHFLAYQPHARTQEASVIPSAEVVSLCGNEKILIKSEDGCSCDQKKLVLRCW